MTLVEQLVADAREMDQAARHVRTEAGRRIAKGLARSLREAADAERKREHRERSSK